MISACVSALCLCFSDVPADQPPPKPPKSIYDTLKDIVANDKKVAFALLLIPTLFLVLICFSVYGSRADAERDAAQPSTGSRTFGNVPLSAQSKKAD